MLCILIKEHSSGAHVAFSESTDVSALGLRHHPSHLCPCPLLSGGRPHPAGTGLRPEEEDGERGDMAFLKDLLSPGPGASDEFSREWQDAFGVFEPPSVPVSTTGTASSGPAACPPSPSPTGFLPSQLLDHSLSSTGQSHRTLLEWWAHGSTDTEALEQRKTRSFILLLLCVLGWSTPPMFQAPPLQPPSGQNQSAQPAPGSAANRKLYTCLHWVFVDMWNVNIHAVSMAGLICFGAPRQK